MTTYLFNGITAAIDRQTTSGDGVRTSCSHSKYLLTQDRTGLFLACGDIADLDLLFNMIKKRSHMQDSDYYDYLSELLIEFNKRRKDMGAEKTSNCDFIVIFVDTCGECDVFKIYDMNTIERKRVEEGAIFGGGSGFGIARGAYYVRGRMRDAMNVASWKDVYTCGSWDTFVVEMSMETARFEFSHKIVYVADDDSAYDSIRKVVDYPGFGCLTLKELDEFEDEFINRRNESNWKHRRDMREFFGPLIQTNHSGDDLQPGAIDVDQEDKRIGESVDDEEAIQACHVDADNTGEMPDEEMERAVAIASRKIQGPHLPYPGPKLDKPRINEIRGVTPWGEDGNCDPIIKNAIRHGHSSNGLYNGSPVENSVITSFKKQFGGILHNNIWYLTREELANLAESVSEGAHLFNREYLRGVVKYHKTHFASSDLVKIPLRFIVDILYDATTGRSIASKEDGNDN